ncbi:MAG: NAD(P)H:quinone oxidoreductase [Armatimonadota bacterium]
MRIYVPFYSRYGNVEQMAKYVAEGVEQVEGAEAMLALTVDTCTPEDVRRSDDAWQETHERLMDEYPAATTDDLAASAGACFGSPTRFGNAAAPMRNFFDSMAGLWLGGDVIGMPAGTFTSTASLHGGQEVTNLTMWPPMIHLGMIIVGVPYSVEELLTTESGGTPYGPSHLANQDASRPVDETEATVCRALGQRVAEIAAKLAG